MVRLDARVARASALSLVAVLVLAACGPGTTSSPGASGGGSSAGPSASGGSAKEGGTVYLLTQADEFNRIDPQRAYTGEDLAFFGATWMRALVAYTVSADDVESAKLVADLATDTGTPNADATSWSFTLREIGRASCRERV